MNSCIQPNKNLYDKIDKIIIKITNKINRILHNDIDDNKTVGGANTLIPVIIGIVVALLFEKLASKSFDVSCNLKGISL